MPWSPQGDLNPPTSSLRGTRLSQFVYGAILGTLTIIVSMLGFSLKRAFALFGLYTKTLAFEIEVALEFFSSLFEYRFIKLLLLH